MIHFPPSFRVGIVLTLTLLAAWTCPAAPAKKRKSPSATPTPAPAVVPSATGTSWIRLWKEDFASHKAVRLELRSKGDTTATIRLEPPANGPHFTDYAAVPAGPATLVFLPDSGEGEAQPPIALTLAADSFTTLLVHEKADVEVLNDAPLGTDPASAELTVRNFVPGIVEVRLQAGDSLNVRLRAPACFLNVRGLERQKCQLDTTTRDAEGKESRWTTEVDFSVLRKATLLIYADPYGRIRPRVARDGQLAATPTNSEPPTGETPAPR